MRNWVQLTHIDASNVLIDKKWIWVDYVAMKYLKDLKTKKCNVRSFRYYDTLDYLRG